MTTLSPRQLNALKVLMGAGMTIGTDKHKRVIVGKEIVTQVDQRPLGGLGRRAEPLIRRVSQNRFELPQAAIDAVQVYEQMEVIRRVQDAPLAGVFNLPQFDVKIGRKRKPRASTRIHAVA